MHEQCIGPVRFCQSAPRLARLDRVEMGRLSCSPMAVATEGPARVELHLDLPYKKEPREDPRVRAWLERGYRIALLQRLTDRDAILLLERPPAEGAAGASS